MGDIVPRDQVSKQAMKGVGGVAGGIGLLVLRGLTATPLVGLIAGGALVVAGGLMSRSKADRRAGMVTVIAGAITAVAALPLVGGLGKFMLLLSGAGLIGTGAYSLYRFFKNLRQRM